MKKEWEMGEVKKSAGGTRWNYWSQQARKVVSPGKEREKGNGEWGLGMKGAPRSSGLGQ